MTSYFRIAIAKKILGTLDSIVGQGCIVGSETLLSTAFKVNRFGRNLPQLILPWSKLLDLKPELSETFKPKQLIAALKNQGLPSPEGINDIAISDQFPSSIMFTLDRNLFTKVVLSDICLNIDVISKKSCLFLEVNPQDILVVYSSPKLGGPFHMGHFRPIIYTNFLANIHAYVGHKVTRCNFIEDWGFSSGLLVAGFQNLGSNEQLEKNPSKHLHEVVKASNAKYQTDKEFREMVASCLQNMKEGNKDFFVWKKLRDAFLMQLRNTYRELGIELNETHLDSMYSEQIDDVMNNLEENTEENETNTEAKLSAQDMNEDSNFSTKFDLYSLARNIAITKDIQSNFNFDAIYFMSNSSKSKIFQDASNILKALGFDWYRNMHSLKVAEVSAFSSGKNKPIFIHDALQSARIGTLYKMKEGVLPKPEDDDPHQNADDVAAAFSIASLFVNDMKYRKNRAYEFDWDEALSAKKHSGIALQLCHAALTRMKEDAKVKLKIDTDTSQLTEPEAFQLVRHLARFDEIIFKAYTYTEPCLILQYLFTLCTLIERAADDLSLDIKGNRASKVKAHLLLFHASQKVLGKGLTLLGIKPVERI